MRPSPYRHPLAVLRKFLKLGQKEMAKLVGCSGATIQAVELLQLRLSGQLALKISRATDASVAWLLAGDPAAPMLNRCGKPYDLNAFSDVWRTDECHYEPRCMDEPMRVLGEFFGQAASAGKSDLAEVVVERKFAELYAEIGLPTPVWAKRYIGELG